MERQTDFEARIDTMTEMLDPDILIMYQRLLCEDGGNRLVIQEGEGE